jgi:desulfoferrodoxin-like iron-binding protein
MSSETDSVVLIWKTLEDSETLIITTFLRKKGHNMAKKSEIYKCDICGMVVEVKEDGGGELVCCGEPMKLQD